MWIKGKLRKPGKSGHWGVEIPELGAHTQGKSRKDALVMAKDWLETMADDLGLSLVAEIADGKGNEFYATSRDTRAFVALILRRLRQQRGSTLKQVAGALGVNSPNAYARYEKGESEPTISKMEELIRAISGEVSIDFIFGEPSRAQSRAKTSSERKKKAKHRAAA